MFLYKSLVNVTTIFTTRASLCNYESPHFLDKLVCYLCARLSVLIKTQRKSQRHFRVSPLILIVTACVSSSRYFVIR